MAKFNVHEELLKTAPPIDWLMAAVLERKMVLGYSLKKMADVAGISYETMRRYIGTSPWNWGNDTRDKICKEFGIRPIRTVQFAPPEDWGFRG